MVGTLVVVEEGLLVVEEAVGAGGAGVEEVVEVNVHDCFA